MIKMKKIEKIYGTGTAKVEALRGIDLDIKKNEFFGLIGPSGSGKSTLMNIIGCLDVPTSGEYYFEEKDIKSFNHNQLAEIRNEKIGFVFQNFNLLPYATTFENVEIPMIFKGARAKERKARTMELLDAVGLAGRAHHKPSELSGGEMQRVAIARALANNPSLILADEPTGNLDTKSGDEILAIFENLWKQGHTLVVITHNPNISKRAQKVVKLKDGSIENNNR
ncbi:MAG: ATP-binding cassette domain-containing protein [Candidatus Aminicenantes bacterium]|nr:ATP-binding cassette domain-containing protein [Candidatus Aminicenantes bacterium]